MLNNDPSRTDVDDRWRSTFSEELPQGPWRDQFLAKANATPEGRALAFSFEGTTLEFSCPDFENRAQLRIALRERIRLINRLLKETRPKGGEGY